jgi:hypothetical protein
MNNLKETTQDIQNHEMHAAVPELQSKCTTY